MCPTCGCTMQKLNTETPIFWCPRCGTLREVHGDFVADEAPKIVDRARIFRDGCILAHGREWADRQRWVATGMDESTSQPNERVA